MRRITMIEHKDGKLSGEILEDGKYWQIPPFEYSGKHKETALLERLDIVQVEAQLEAELGGGNER